MSTFSTGAILIYAMLVGVGGIVGFVKSRSKVSISSGLGSAVLLVVAWAIARQYPSTGLIGAALIGGALCAVFITRLAKTRKLMPAGVMAGLSLAATVIFLLGYASS